MMRVIYVTLCIQVLTFLVLGVVYLRAGAWRLGVAQLLLAAVQGVIYSGSLR